MSVIGRQQVDRGRLVAAGDSYLDSGGREEVLPGRYKAQVAQMAGQLHDALQMQSNQNSQSAAHQNGNTSLPSQAGDNMNSLSLSKLVREQILEILDRRSEYSRWPRSDRKSLAWCFAENIPEEERSAWPDMSQAMKENKVNKLISIYEGSSSEKDTISHDPKPCSSGRTASGLVATEILPGSTMAPAFNRTPTSANGRSMPSSKTQSGLSQGYLRDVVDVEHKKHLPTGLQRTRIPQGNKIVCIRLGNISSHDSCIKSPSPCIECQHGNVNNGVCDEGGFCNLQAPSTFVSSSGSVGGVALDPDNSRPFTGAAEAGLPMGLHHVGEVTHQSTQVSPALQQMDRHVSNLLHEQFLNSSQLRKYPDNTSKVFDRNNLQWQELHLLKQKALGGNKSSYPSIAEKRSNGGLYLPHSDNSSSDNVCLPQSCKNRGPDISASLRRNLYNSHVDSYGNYTQSTYDTWGPGSEAIAKSTGVGEHIQCRIKRPKTEGPSFSVVFQSEAFEFSQTAVNDDRVSNGMIEVSHLVNVSAEASGGIMKYPDQSCSGLKQGSFGNSYNIISSGAHSSDSNAQLTSQEQDIVNSEKENIEVLFKANLDAPEVKPATSASIHAHEGRVISIKPKTICVSLCESFTPDRIRGHISSLMQPSDQSKQNKELKQASEGLKDRKTCTLCKMAEIPLKQFLRNCTKCNRLIKDDAAFYVKKSSNTTTHGNKTQDSYCKKCSRSILVELEVMRYSKTHEKWIECGKCKGWQHRICALYNAKLDESKQAEYNCPCCILKEMDITRSDVGLRKHSFLGAEDLQTSVLSDHLEERLRRSLKQEKEERARNLRKKFDEVPGAEGLVVRVVSSVNKTLNVNKLISEMFQDDHYPTRFPYKSKAILLFQKIDGVDVCLFIMYVQEYGPDCPEPNKRRAYLSYIDSVKYFVPDVKTVKGEGLRTFVYHEILIGYIDYIKKRGFRSFSIWVCPPAKGDDYIFYCHPTIQKIPRQCRLCEWYLTAAKKALERKIVLHRSNLYDHFFHGSGESKMGITAACLPYFNGDLWPTIAEQLLQHNLGTADQKQEDKVTTGRTKRATKRVTLTAKEEKILLMKKLEESIRPRKEECIIMLLHYACTHCDEQIIHGRLWVCNFCPNFHLCENCYHLEQKLDQIHRHPAKVPGKHSFHAVEVDNEVDNANDEDETIECRFFDTRLDFLNLCSENKYTYDTLRRAKHSSMMVLYHLHKNE